VGTFFGGDAPPPAVADFLEGGGAFLGACAFREEGFLAVVRCDGFFRVTSSSLLSALGLRLDNLGIVQLCARRKYVSRREFSPPPQRGVMLGVSNETNWFG
jgi:hypothetical protein